MEPRDKDGRRKLKECENALRKQRFEEAIMTPEAEVVRCFHLPMPHTHSTRTMSTHIHNNSSSRGDVGPER